jgi:cell division septum initiation protein DivIVA
MSTLELNRLEEDVAKARERVVTDVARLRSPAAMAEFKADIGQTLSDSAQRTVENLKNRAAANPAAVLAIAAGLLWRFARHPPIASLLVGVGLASLLRTSPDSPPSPVVTRSGELLHAANEKASELTEQAREFSGQAREAVASTAATLSQTAGRIADQVAQTTARVSEQGARVSAEAARMSGQATDTATRISGQAAETAARMSEGAGQFAAQASRSADRLRVAAQQALPDMPGRDGLLLGVAAVAVGAAARIGLRRDAA